jgi:peptidoglycan glycosyltransferase
LLFLWVWEGSSYGLYNLPPTIFSKKNSEDNLEHRVQISNSIRNSVKKSQFPTQAELTIGSKQGNFHVAYTLDPKLQLEAENLLKSYKPDYGAIFMMDAKTGQVLAMASFDKGDSDADHMALKASYPAASVFKIVTATTAIDRAGVSPGHSISFNGGNYTLYRKNVMSEKINRWTRTITLRDAFARSINTAFGRLSLQNFEPTDLNEYANRFMFNQVIPSDFPIDMSIATVPAKKTLPSLRLPLVTINSIE